MLYIPAGFPHVTDTLECNGVNPQPSTRNPKPETLHSKPYTLSPKPYTLNPKPYTLNPQPHTLNQVTSPDTSVHLTLGVDTCAPFPLFGAWVLCGKLTSSLPVPQTLMV